ncbi:MAG: FadR/GntR family transcriptional regulator [Desulfitobacteriaceae bacterium]|nr:FadR/GntR family transcriptional regulator [Desulfitobacteriaceae bacterium]MDD4402267.1 FadR/GntR family transcriptional regulator [Desulfitobacteriaceae bacterium]
MAIQKFQMHELVYEKLKEIILSGRFKEGDYLPSQLELAQELGISRSALRGAILLLRKMGVVEVTPGIGTIIRSVTFPANSRSVLQDTHDYKDQILELLEFRISIEIEAAGLAAERATNEQIIKLREAYEYLVTVTRNGYKGTEADLNFHLVLVEISGNKLFYKIMLSIIDLFRDIIDKVRQDTRNKSGEKAIEELERHKKILNAIEGRDKIKARKIKAENLEYVYNTVRSWL